MFHLWPNTCRLLIILSSVAAISIFSITTERKQWKQFFCRSIGCILVEKNNNSKSAWTWHRITHWHILNLLDISSWSHELFLSMLVDACCLQVLADWLICLSYCNLCTHSYITLKWLVIPFAPKGLLGKQLCQISINPIWPPNFQKTRDLLIWLIVSELSYDFKVWYD